MGFKRSEVQILSARLEGTFVRNDECPLFLSIHGANNDLPISMAARQDVHMQRTCGTARRVDHLPQDQGRSVFPGEMDHASRGYCWAAQPRHFRQHVNERSCLEHL